MNQTKKAGTKRTSTAARASDKEKEVAKTVLKKTRDGISMDNGDLSRPTVDLSDLDDLKNRLVIRIVNSRSTHKWTIWVKKKLESGKLSEDTIQPIRFRIDDPHKIMWQPKRFKEGPGQPFACSIPLGTLREDDRAIIDFLTALKLLIAQFLLDHSDKKNIIGEEAALEWFDNPEFYKGPLSFWQMNVDLKARFEYEFNSHKPTFLLMDCSIPTSPRLMTPDYVESDNGLSGTFTLGGFYVMMGKTKIQVTNEVGGQETREEERLMCGMTCAATVIKRISTQQMEVLDPTDKTDIADDIQAQISGDAWKNLSWLSETH